MPDVETIRVVFPQPRLARVSVTLPEPLVTTIRVFGRRSGLSGYSGYCGLSGYSGFCGLSGYSGYSGSGVSGYSGYSGSGISGYSGHSGIGGGIGGSGYSGFCGLSGYSGFCGLSGYSGYSGSGTSGYSGYSGSGTSGYSGFCGLSGYSGFCGLSGYSGFCGLSGYSGYSGSGVSGYSGYSGTGLSGYSGFSGDPAQESGYSGFSGKSGYSGFCGLSGYSGFCGTGTSGYSGYCGLSGYSGYCGLSGYSGFSGPSGYSGYSGSGLSGYSGFCGAGTSGYSGFCGRSGYSGFSGVGGVSSIPVGNTLFVDADNGNDGTGTRGQLDKPYLTIPAAVADALDGDVIVVGPGDFAGAIAIELPDGVSLVGAGVDATRIVADAGAITASGYQFVRFGDRSLVSDLTIDCLANDDLAAIGSDEDADFTKSATAINLRLLSQNDGFYFVKGANDPVWNFTAYNCRVVSYFDACMIQAAGNYDFYECEQYSDASLGLTEASQGYIIYRGTVRVFGGSIRVGGGSLVNVCADSTQNNSQVLELHNVRLERVAGGTTAFDLRQAQSGVLKINDVVRDDGAALTTFGTITDLFPGGTSGYSGYSGKSGYSGFCGLSGYSGYSGISGYSGFCGMSGYSGFSAASPGDSGYSGFSGASGYSGYSGFSGKSGYSGYSGPSLLPTSTQTDTDYTLVITDAATIVKMSSGSAHTLTIPLNASVAFAVGTQIVIEQGGTAAVTIAATGGVTLQGSTLTNGQYTVITLIKQATDTWLAASAASGYSGYSGYSGKSGYSGYSGFCGLSGYSGFSAASPGASGYSGYSGSGVSGYSGYCGMSGYSGYCGLSGYSGFCGESGYSGYSSISGYSGYSGSTDTVITGATGTVDQSAVGKVTIQILTSNNSDIPTTTVVTQMTAQTMGVGWWLVEYFIIWQSDVSSTGITFVVDHTGTAANSQSVRFDMIGSTTALATIGRANAASNLGVTGALPSLWSARTDNAVLGPNEGVDLVDVNQMTRITAQILVTGSGDLTLRANSEIAATATRVMAGTTARYTRLS